MKEPEVRPWELIAITVAVTLFAVGFLSLIQWLNN